MSDNRADAIILATPDTGFGTPEAPSGQASSLQEAGGEPLVSRVVRACRASASIEKVVVISGQDAPGAPFGADEHLEALPLPADSIQQGLSTLNGCGSAVVLPGDVPFLSGDEIDAFVAAAADREAQMGYPLVPRASCEAAFPDLRQTYFRLTEGELTGGNALFIDVPTFLSNDQILVQAMELRNEPWKLALAINPLILLSYRAGGLALAEIESAAQKALGIRGAAVIVDAPGLATDIRKPIELRAARRRLGEA